MLVLLSMPLRVGAEDPESMRTGTGASVQTTETERFRVSTAVPPGFEALTEKQSTQADIYYGGIFLLSTFVTYDPMSVEILDPSAVVEAIPNIRDPVKLARQLSGPLPNNASRRCHTRVAGDCGKLDPEVAAVMFDDATYRMDLFVSPQELMVHELAREKYLPPPDADQSTLHNVRMNISGVGSDKRFNLSSESYFAWNNSRVHTRYGASDRGLTLNEISWQRDDPDMEYEIGSFRTKSGELAFAGDLAVLGIRMGTSTRTRTDLAQATGTPVFLFLDERSQVNIYRGNELIDSRFLNAGNHELDTRNYPGGAYDINIETVGMSGARNSHTQFFVRSHNIPPKGEPQYFIETGALMSSDHVGMPRLDGGAWLRGGASHRLAHNLSLDSEMLYADETTLMQSGFFWLNHRAQVYAGAMASTDGDFGYLLRASYQHRSVTAFFDVRQLEVADKPSESGEFSLLRGSYLQGSASLAFLLHKGRMFLRATVNDQKFNDRSGLGISYLGPLFDRWGFRADLRLDAHFSDDDNWVKAGVTFRRIRGSNSTVFTPSLRSSEVDGIDSSFNGYWNGQHHWDPVGHFQRSTYINHENDNSVLGTRFMPRNFDGSDFEFGLQERHRGAELFYALNSSMSIATTPERTTIGDGASTAGAVVIDINGDLEGQFEVRVDTRVVGYAWANRPNVISLRPYETYRIRVNPISDNIVGFDESIHEVTIYPGNVEVLEFKAHEITVLVGQAVDDEGEPLKFARFRNVVGLGLTDGSGWYQVEIMERAPLVLARKDGRYCRIDLPELEIVQNLAVLDVLTCTIIPEPPSIAEWSGTGHQARSAE